MKRQVTSYELPVTRIRFQVGFTLIELTIGITLLALMALILYGVFYLGHRAVEKAQAQSEESHRLRSMEGLLGGYIRSAYPYRSSQQDPTIYFSGGEGHLVFVSALSSGMGGRGMSKVSLLWDAATGLVVLEEEIPLRLEGQGEEGGHRNGVILQRGVKAFRIEYLDSQAGEERWVESWEGKERKVLPRAARIQLRNQRGQEIEWLFPIMVSVLTP